MELSSSSDLLTSAVQRCRSAGLRRTKALEEVLRTLIDSLKPLTLAEVAESLRDQCDKATVYRLLVRLEEKGVLRKLGFHDRSAHYAMRYPDRHDDYLICTECGSIDSLDISCPVEALEREISESSGYHKVYHELEFYGVCPACAE